MGSGRLVGKLTALLLSGALVLSSFPIGVLGEELETPAGSLEETEIIDDSDALTEDGTGEDSASDGELIVTDSSPTGDQVGAGENDDVDDESTLAADPNSPAYDADDESTLDADPSSPADVVDEEPTPVIDPANPADNVTAEEDNQSEEVAVVADSASESAAESALESVETESDSDGLALETEESQQKIEVQSGDKEPALTAQSTAKTTVTYTPVTPIKLTLGSAYEDIDWDTGEPVYQYQYYPQDGDKIKVTTGSTSKTFTFDESTYGWKNKKGEYAWMDVQLYANLSAADNKLGSHKMNVDYFKNDSYEARGTISFKIVESPLSTIAYKPAYDIVLVKGVDSSKYYEYDAETKTGHNYHHYFFPTGTRLLGDELTLTYEDGITKRYVYKTFKNPTHGYADQGYVNTKDATDIIYRDDLEFSNQTYKGRWGSGKHSFVLTHMGCSTKVPVRVKAQTVAKVKFSHSGGYRRKTTSAIAYTKKMGIYDADYAKKVTRYEIVFKAPKPASGDILKVTSTNDVTTTYVYSAKRKEFVNKKDKTDTIPRRDVTFGSCTIDPTTTTAAYPCSYKGVEFSVPFKVTKAKQTVKAKGKEIVVGKEVELAYKTTGFAESKFHFKSSNPQVATVNSQGVVTAKSIGKVKITVRAKANAAFKKSAAKAVIVRVGKANPMKVKSKAKVKIRRGRTAAVMKVTKGKGTLKYANVSTSKTGKTFKVNSKTGKVTIPKKTKKGTYTMKVKVKAAGTGRTYLSKSKIVTVKVVVK